MMTDLHDEDDVPTCMSGNLRFASLVTTLAVCTMLRMMDCEFLIVIFFVLGVAIIVLVMATIIVKIFLVSNCKFRLL